MNDPQPESLICEARKRGASDAALISARDIVVVEHLADICRQPGCPNYGLARSCPPHVAGPGAFRRWRARAQGALVFRIDVPSDILLGDQNRDVFQLLHEVAAGLERAAAKMGYADSRAFAGGSCKTIFCHDLSACPVLSEKGEGRCRHPHIARPSMSGFGIDVARLFETVGWELLKARDASDPDAAGVSHLCGLVLVARTGSHL